MPTYTSLLFDIEDWVADGEDYVTIKRKVEAADLPKEDQLKLLTRIDDFIVQRELYEDARRQSLLQMMLGGTIFLMGFMFWYGVPNTGIGQKLLFIAALVSGLYIFRKGWLKFKLPPRHFDTMQEQKNKFDRYRTKSNK